MADILAVTSHRTEQRVSRKWSRQSSTLAIIGMSLLGWAMLGSALQRLPLF